MAEIVSTFEHNDSGNFSSATSDSSSAASTSPRSLSPNTGWIIKYKTIPKKAQSNGIWDGYQTKEEFIMMHLR